MPAPAADCASDPAATAGSPPPSGSGIPNINPSTGLSTDYLNHFTEALMALEMAPAVPECLDDLRAWRSKSYTEHFAASRFRDRSAVINAYRSADPVLRAAVDQLSATINEALSKACSEMLRCHGSPAADASACHASDMLRPLIARAAALINGTASAAEQHAPQSAIDAMFDQ